MNQASDEIPQPNWCRPCGIPHPPDARACLHCGQPLSGASADVAGPGAFTPPARATLARQADPPAGRRAAKAAIDVEAEAAAIVARAMALEATATSAPTDQIAARLAPPGPMPALPDQPRYLPVTGRAVLQRAWLVAGLLLCLLLVAFALLVARDAAMLGR